MDASGLASWDSALVQGRADTTGLTPLITELEAAAAGDTAAAPVWARLAMAYAVAAHHGMGEGHVRRAQQALIEAVALAPRSVDAQRAIGWVKLYAEHDLEEALRMLRIVRERRPDDSVTVELIGEALHDLGREGEAAAAGHHPEDHDHD